MISTQLTPYLIVMFCIFAGTENNMIQQGTTVYAPATSGGGAIAIIRVTGPDAVDILSGYFKPFRKSSALHDVRGYTMIHGDIADNDDYIDEVIVLFFRAPLSYTGEDMIEISCHASSFIQRRIMDLLNRKGALPALPGEFTMRAFLNGKMDLSQAEAVADLIASGTEASHRIAVHQMRGGFSSEISRLRSDLLHFVSLMELEMDFGEEEIEFADRKELIDIVVRVKEISDRLASSFKLGNVIKNGIPVVITGKPNTGKSTLLNALLKEDKAIVSEIPGTTRDVIEDTIVIDGLMYRFFDTAGLHETTDIIENLGIKKTHEKIDQASVVMLIDEITETPEAIKKRAEGIREMTGDSRHLIILINKTDLGTEKQKDDITSSFTPGDNEKLLFISAKYNTGLEELKSELGSVVEKARLASDNVIISNIRHYEALLNVSLSLERVKEGILAGLPDDIVSIDIRQAIHYLGEITGEITTDEILGNIFRNFCIGK
jgi:tRNA modification GTPase